MKISRIEFENFRNFKNRGEIRCSTDGKVTIIYGRNGDGKTTLHQLIQWIFYEKTTFNRTTTSDKLYNLSYEADVPINTNFNVIGCIDFEHEGEQYTLRRTYTYKKGLNGSEKISGDIALNKMDNDNNWRRVQKPQECIESFLPSGLSDYFFFDGETMIADLHVRGRESADKLRKALYTIFDLNIIEAAISHLGQEELKTTVLGKLYLSKGNSFTDVEISNHKTNISKALDQLDKINEIITENENKKNKNREEINIISEKIGNGKTKSSYEKERAKIQKQRDCLLESARNSQSDFGEAIFEMFPAVLISQAIKNAQRKMHLKIQSSPIPTGLEKDLINYLLQDTTSECVCGRKLDEEAVSHIRKYLQLFPPQSYASRYHNFISKVNSLNQYLDEDKLDRIIQNVARNNEQAETCDKSIIDLDNDAKQSPDIEELVTGRQNKEKENKELDNEITKFIEKKGEISVALKLEKKRYDDKTKSTEAGKRVERQIKIINAVAGYFRETLADKAQEYSEKLQINIQELIEKMLDSNRKVTVDDDFSFCVKDNFGDESKSEGQFAVVSFAYIGGILNLLRGEKSLFNKEYPLILDGPFSKLDEDHKKNVAEEIPKFASQVILFSKDQLEDVFDKEHRGLVWTITSNDDKNIAEVKEGYLWK